MAFSLIIGLTACADLQVANESYLVGDYQRAFDDWTVLADKGFPEAHYRLAEMLAEGVMGSERIPEALDHYQQAVTIGYSRAASGLGRFLIRHGRNLDQTEAALKILNDAARRGDVGARLAMADLQLAGSVIERNVEAALATLLDLAEWDEPRAIYRLGIINETGIYVPQDYVAAARYYNHAYGLGYGRAGLYLANLYEFGLGVEQDIPRARDILTELSETGDAAASYRLAGLIERQDSSALVPELALQLYHESASTGYSPARLKLARLYLEGESVPKDVSRAVRIIEQLSAQSYGPATTQLGDLYRDGDHKLQDYGRAYTLYSLAFEQGHDAADMRIGSMFRHGWGVPQDLDAARAIFLKYANLGDVSAAYKLAQVMEEQAPEGEFPKEALPWYQRAATARHAGARLRMALLYLEGQVVTQDIERALSEFRALDEAEYRQASRSLGDLHRDGEYLERDHVEAERLYLRALDLGDESSKMRLADLYAKGDPEVLDFAKAEAIYIELMASGDIPATYKLARLHEQQLRSNSITPQIVEWYRKAAESGYPPALLRYADLQLEGLGVRQDVDAALSVFHEMAATGLGPATFRLGRVREYGEAHLSAYQESFALYRQAVEQGYGRAEMQIGKLYAQGAAALGDLDRAKDIFEGFANSDSARAAFELGELYLKRGQEISEDWQSKSATWYRRAIDLGSVEARYALVRLLESANESPTEESMELLRMAADSGYGRAMLDLGRRMYRGVYLDENATEGLALVLVSARLNTSRAVEAAVDLMAEIGDPETIDQARVRATEIYQTHFGAAEAGQDENEDNAQADETEES
jgi:TPR repeat protein